jgi:hypothetical protein
MWVRHHSNEAMGDVVLTLGTSATVKPIVQSVALDVHLTHSPCLLIPEDLRGLDLDQVRQPSTPIWIDLEILAVRSGVLVQ